MNAADILTLTAPLLWAALAELLGQKAGVLNIGIEGIMLIGCLVAALVAPSAGPFWAIAAAAIVCAAVNTLFALVIILGADQVVAGTGLVLVGMGATGLIFRHVQTLGSASGLLPMAAWGPLEIGALLLVPLIAWWLKHTKAGLVLRACGENPHAVEAAGISVLRVRLIALLIAGAFVGIGGATLVLRASGAFVEGMTAGRGFLALAIVLLGRWRPLWIACGSIALGALTAAQLSIQGLGFEWLPYHLLIALPYMLTLIVLALIPSDRHGGPAALGKAFRSQK